MTLRRRLIPVAALVLAIGASAAGAATAAETGTGGTAGRNAKDKATASCKIELKGGTIRKGPGVKNPAAADHTVLKNGSDPAGATDPAGTDAAEIAAKAAANAANAADAAKVPAKGQTELKGGPQQPAGPCKKVEAINLDKIATELGVSKTALVQALDETKQWIVASKSDPGTAQYVQHLADLLHLPEAKVASVFGPHGLFAASSGA